MAIDATKNLARADLSTGYDASATSVVLASGHGARFPDPAASGAFNAVWWDRSGYPDPVDDPNVEIVRVTGRSTDTLTISRAQEGTSASVKNTASHTYSMALAPTAKMFTDMEAAYQKGTALYGVDSGSNDTYVVTLSPAIAAYAAGMKVRFKANTANTGACTLNVNSVGAANIKMPDGSDPIDNAIKALTIVETVYDGTNFVLTSASPNPSFEDLHIRESAFFDAEYDNGNSSTADTITWGNGNKQKSTFTGNCTLTFVSPQGPTNTVLRIIQDGTGSRTLDEIVTGSGTFQTTDVNTTNETITVGTELATGTRIRFSGTVPTGLVAATIYWAINVNPTTIKVASSYANAIAGTAINLSSTGSGTMTWQKLVKWAGGTKPTLTTAAGSVDILGFYYDGDQWYGASSLAFT